MKDSIRKVFVRLSKTQKIVIILFFLLGISLPLIVASLQKSQDIRQQAAEGTPTSNCRIANNLVQNCDFQTLDANGFPEDWTDVRNDARRQANPDDYTGDFHVVTSNNNKNSLELGKATGTCAMPKTADGGIPSLPFKLFPELRQHILVGNAQNFTLSFDFQMKSRHTQEFSAPFYVWAGFSNTHNRNDQGKGKELFIAYTPHNAPGQQYCSEPFRSEYRCMSGISGINRTEEQDCSESFNGWRHVEISFPRSELCTDSVGSPVNQDCVNENTELFVGFGVTNDYDTLVSLDNIVLQGEGINSPIPSARSKIYIQPAPTQEGTTTLTATSDLVCSAGFSMNEGSGLECGQPKVLTCSGGNPKDTKPCWWQWECTGKNPGNYQASFLVSGSPACKYYAPYTVGQKIASSPSPTVSPTATPTSTPTPLIGDFNKNGAVDEDDYKLWKEKFVPKTYDRNIDANNNNTIDIGDFNIWRENK